MTQSQTLTLSPTSSNTLTTNPDTYTVISIDNSTYPLQDSAKTSIYQDIYRALKNEGVVQLKAPMSDDESMGFLLAGFVVVDSQTLKKQSVQMGMKMSLKSKEVVQTAQKWTLDTTEDEELVDEDALLEDEDLAKPIVPSESDCSTKRKACKNCSCGRAEEEEEQEKLSRQAKMELIRGGVVTGCGSCGLGDAFRCSTCPFMGMPKFVPGQENGSVMLDLTDDI